MSATQRIIKNTVILISSQLFSKVINLVLILLLAHILGVESFGIYSFSFAYTTLFMFLVHLGINNLLIREVAREKENASTFLGATFPVLILMGSINFIIINVIALLAQWHFTERAIIFIFCFYIIFDTGSRYFICVARAFEKMEYEALLTIFERILLLLVTLIIWMFDFGLILLATGFSIVQLTRMLWAYKLITKNFVSFKISWNPAYTLSLLREAYPFALVGMFGTISTRIDLVMIRIFHTPELAGIYNVARKLIESWIFVPENIYYAVFPVLSVYYLKDKDYFNLTFQRMLLILCSIVFLLVPGIFIFASDIINLLFEPAFADAYIPLQYLALALGIIFIKHAFAVTLNSVGKQHLFSLITGIAMIFNVGLNLLLIPKYSIFGAALATVISESLTFIFAFIATYHIVSISFIRWKLVKLIFVSILTSFIMYIMHDINVIVAAVSASIFYFTLIYLMKIISDKNFREIKNLFLKNLHSQAVSENQS